MMSMSSVTQAIFSVTEVTLISKRFPTINLCLPSDTVVPRRHHWCGTSHSSGHFFPRAGMRRWILFKSLAKIITHKIMKSECNHLGPFKAALLWLAVLFQLLIIGILKYSSASLEIHSLSEQFIHIKLETFIFQVNLTSDFSLSLSLKSLYRRLKDRISMEDVMSSDIHLSDAA